MNLCLASRFQVDGNSAGEGSKACNEICSTSKIEGSSVMIQSRFFVSLNGILIIIIIRNVCTKIGPFAITSATIEF